MPKTTFRANKTRWDYFNKECQACNWRRDQAVNRLLPGEIALLEQIPASDDAGFHWLKNNWLGDGGQLTGEDTVHVAVTLDKEVLDRLNTACESKRVPRDAFFHCFLQFITTRLYEAAVVMKDPRTTKDVASAIADIMSNDEYSNRDRKDFVFEVAEQLFNSRQLGILSSDYYSQMLSYDQARIDRENIDIL